jgi:hypothetical protein
MAVPLEQLVELVGQAEVVQDLLKPFTAISSAKICSIVNLRH